MTGIPKKHCWECRRRCLVCDSAEPVCSRCTRSGVQCPGYGPAKPTNLRWLAPGAVLSRRPRRKRGKDSSAHDAGSNRFIKSVSKSDEDRAVDDGRTLLSLPRVVRALSFEPYNLAEAAEYCKPTESLPLRMAKKTHLVMISFSSY